MEKTSILFISTMDGEPWGGSEELWSQTARNLALQGYAVSASVTQWSPPHQRIIELSKGGVDVRFRPSHYSIWKKVWHRATSSNRSKLVIEMQRLLAKQPPALVVFSEASTFPFPAVELLELCVNKNVPFITIAQANSDNHWVDDARAERYRKALTAARQCFFVSNANLRLAERQLGARLNKAEVIRNPFNVDFHTRPTWPSLNANGELRLACVARLHPPSKGQDILLAALAEERWSTRNWRLTLYGNGPMRDVLERLSTRLNLSNRVYFGGHISVADIWANNHALVMPSRCEGLPLAMVEAMLSARPVVATNVAGHSEIIEDGITGFLAAAPTVPNLSQSLERLWEQRANLEKMGMAGAERIRQLVPSDPIHVFTEKVKSLLQNEIMVPAQSDYR